MYRILWLAILPLSLYSPNITAETPPEWLTVYEKSGYTETSRHAETVEFCRKLDEASEAVEYRSFGTTPEGRELPLLTVNSDLGSNAPLIFIIAGIHPGEIDGKDAGLMLIRDVIVSKQHKGLFDNVRIAFVPIFNVDGHEQFGPHTRMNQLGPKEAGRRITSQNLDLNRDWLKADAPEMRAMLSEINRLQPDFLMDLHVTDGADYQYVISYGLGTHENEFPSIREFNRDIFLPNVKKLMNQISYDFVPYVLFRKGYDILSGWEDGVYPPRYSTGYGTAINRPFMLIETHSLKEYSVRVKATYEFLKIAIGTIRNNKQKLLAANHEADKYAADLSGKPYLLNWKLTSDSSIVEFAGVKYDWIPTSIGKDSVVRWSSEPQTFHIPYFNTSIPTDTITVPHAYVIPPQWMPRVEPILTAHGLTTREIRSEITLNVETYTFSDVDFADSPYEGRFRTTFKSKRVGKSMTFLPGSGVVFLNHPRAQVAIHLLEPDAPDSFIRWGFFPQIFEQKEYGDSYILDTLALRMLQESPQLKAEFESRLATDSTFAASSDLRYNFFYERSPYWDERKNLYPIARISDPQELARLQKAVARR